MLRRQNSRKSRSRLGYPAPPLGPVAQADRRRAEVGHAAGPGQLIDGNLVLYPNWAIGDPARALWASNTHGDNTALMQGDGNFVIYPSAAIGDPAAARWATNTTGDNALVVQANGNVVIYPAYDIGDPNAARWAKNTHV